MKLLILPNVGASFKKWGCCIPILFKALAHFSKLPKINFKKIKKIQKKSGSLAYLGVDPPAAGQHLDRPDCPFFLNFFFSCLPLFAQVVNSCWLAPAHAHPGQTLPKNFKHP
jgi:hypothetical protein